MSAIGVRRVEPEWLDELPAGDARATRSRRDLTRVNALMANAGIVARALVAEDPSAPIHLVEIGAGDGRFALRLARALPPPRAGACFTLVDRQAIADAQALAGLAARGWATRVVRSDVFDWLESADAHADAIVANLFLHHFEPVVLGRMLALVASRAQRFVACEPRRSTLALAGSHLLGAIGCNDVTRHDAVVSVRAGFRDGEIAALWPAGAGWTLAEGRRGLFSHGFAARLP